MRSYFTDTCTGEYERTVQADIIEPVSGYGKGFDYSSLYKFVRFYKEFPEILDSVNPKSLPMLSWTHYRVLLQVEDKKARDWYEKEAAGVI